MFGNVATSINDFSEKIKPYFGLISIVLLAFLTLGFWQLHSLAGTKTPLKIVNIAPDEQGQAVTAQNVIASKTGTKYYLPWCGAIKRIKPENQISFASAAEARAAGYQPAGNCKGTK